METSQAPEAARGLVHLQEEDASNLGPNRQNVYRNRNLVIKIKCISAMNTSLNTSENAVLQAAVTDHDLDILQRRCIFLLKSIQFLVSGSHSIKPRDELIMDKETHTCAELKADPLTPSSQQGDPCSRWNHPTGGMKLQHSFLHYLWRGEMV